MTKYGIAEQVISRLYPKGSVEAKASMQEVQKAVDQARDALVRGLTWKRMDDDDYSPPYQCIQPYKNVPVAYDSDMKKWYCVLPARVVDLPKNMGVYYVATMTDPDSAYVPSELGSNTTSIYGDGGVGRYYPEKKKLFFNRDLSGYEMFLRLVPCGEDIDPLADYLFPPDMEEILVDAAYNKFIDQRKIPVDAIDDRNSQ